MAYRQRNNPINTPVLKVEMEDDVMGKANKDGTIHINKNINDPKQIQDIVDHEKVHLDQMQRGDLDYDDNNVIWKGKKYSPRLLMLVANKADRFFDQKAAELWQQGRIGEHKIFDPFRDELIRLQKAGMPTKRAFMATRVGWNVEPTMIDLLTT